jgi:flagellin
VICHLGQVTALDDALAAQGTFANNAVLKSSLITTAAIFENFITSNINMTTADNSAFGCLDSAGGASKKETFVWLTE